MAAADTNPMIAYLGLLVGAATPSPSPTVVDLPAADPIQTAGAVIAIVLALAAGILGYRILRGGRGL
ncbi:MAG TPA: hypothetical protein VJ927_05130 [Actinomycetota bacterium]|nr:hypothetical protein [Actinomycetota bacterium]